MGRIEDIRVVFRGFSADRRSALIVGISRRGVHVTEVADVRSCFDQSPPAPYLATTAVFSWQKFRGRERCYSGDDGSGSLRQRIVAGAISLIACHGGAHAWLTTAQWEALMRWAVGASPQQAGPVLLVAHMIS